MLIDSIIKTLGIPLFCIYIFYLVLGFQAYFSVKNIYIDFQAFRDNKKVDEDYFSSFVMLFDQLKKAVLQKSSKVIDNRIDQIWIEFDRKVQTPVASIGSYSNSLILWGFVGTLYGSVKAFASMSDMLVKETNVSQAFASIMHGKLDVALYSSLFASFLAALATTLVTSYLGSKITKGMEYHINDEIYKILNE